MSNQKSLGDQGDMTQWLCAQIARKLKGCSNQNTPYHMKALIPLLLPTNRPLLPNQKQKFRK